VREILKFGAILLIVGGTAFGFLSVQQRTGYGLETGKPVPDFTLPALAGGTSGLASLRGHVVLLNFWATWCPPCVGEMPSLDRLGRALGAEGLVVVGISVDADEAALKEFVARHALGFRILRDTGAHTAAAYRVTGYPQTFVIARDGTLLKTFLGPAEWDTPEATAYFRGLLARDRATDASTSPAR
jgi:peroxiredoxin